MSDDKPSRAEQHLINEARKHQARQPQPPDKVTIGRVGRPTTVATVIVWDIETGQPVSAKFLFEHEQGRRQPVAGVSPSPDGRPIAVAVDFIPPVIWKIVGDLPHFVA